jgi:glycosyltransferase involved in cell wall biosynthesis
MVTSKKISFVIPAFNEAMNVKKIYDELVSAIGDKRFLFEFIFVDDGSTDSTLNEIKSLIQKDDRIFFIELSRNFGHQNALKAGLDLAHGDCVITMDCDLQHPPPVVAKLIQKWEEGYDIVYTKRKEDRNLSWFKKKSSSVFYALHNQLADIKLEKGTADFRLMSRVALNAFSHLNESELFIRGLVKWAGFKQVSIEYEPKERFSGQSKYTLKEMLSLALKGIVSFSVKPLKLAAYLGFILFIPSIFLVAYALGSYFLNVAISGWTSLMITIIFFGSLQLLMLGIIGIYLSKLIIQSKQRPLYFIRETNYK